MWVRKQLRLWQQLWGVSLFRFSFFKQSFWVFVLFVEMLFLIFLIVECFGIFVCYFSWIAWNSMVFFPLTLFFSFTFQWLDSNIFPRLSAFRVLLQETFVGLGLLIGLLDKTQTKGLDLFDEIEKLRKKKKC